MKKALVFLPLLVVASLVLAACSPPPPLRSDKYLKDVSLVSVDPCGPPCFQNITVGTTKYADALTKIKANPLFSNIKTQDAQQGNPAQATWATAAGEDCCQMISDDHGLVSSLLVKLAPGVTVSQLIGKYGKPDYVTDADYSADEVAVALIFKTNGLIAWVTPGNATSSLQENNPVVVAYYLNPTDIPKLLDTATLQGWNGYQPYVFYKTATPIITPRVTATPQ